MDEIDLIITPEDLKDIHKQITGNGEWLSLLMRQGVSSEDMRTALILLAFAKYLKTQGITPQYKLELAK